MMLPRPLLLACALIGSGCATTSLHSPQLFTPPLQGNAEFGNPAAAASGAAAPRASRPGPLGGNPYTAQRPSVAQPFGPPARAPGRTPSAMDGLLARPNVRGATPGAGIPPATRSGTPAAIPPAFRPDVQDDLLRKPFQDLRPLQASPPADNSGAREPDGNRPFAPPQLPDPRAGIDAVAATADSNNAGWKAQAGAAAQAARHERTSLASATAGAAQIPWKPAASSHGGRAIEVLQLGQGPRHILITASLLGNEQAAVTFIERLADLLQREPDRLAGRSVLLIRTPNPDGLAEGTLTNARGVALNRNFPSRNFLGQRTPETGPAPASELETRALIGLCDDFRPDRVVHIRGGNGQRPLVLANHAAVEELRQVLDRSLMDGGEFEVFKAGSLEEYTDEHLRAELLHVALPADTGAFEKLLPTLANLLVGPRSSNTPAAATEAAPQATPAMASSAPAAQKHSAGVSDLFAPYQPPAARGTPVETSSARSAAEIPRGKRGYVQLLPPPAEFADPAAGFDPKYFELTPPPE